MQNSEGEAAPVLGRPRAVEAVVAGIAVRAVGFDDLIRLKRAARRDRDREDAATLLVAAKRSAEGDAGPSG